MPKASDDELLKMLRDTVREDEQVRHPDLDRLVYGELPSDARASLQATAASDPSLAREVAWNEPLDEAARDRMHAAVMRHAAPPSAARSPVRAVKSSFRRMLPMGAAATGAIAMAAAVALVVRHRGGAALLPPYDAELVSENVATRSSGDHPAMSVHVQSSQRFDWVARPTTHVRSAIRVQTFTVHQGAARTWSPPVEISPEGSVRITGPVTALFDDPQGEWELIVAIGPASATTLTAETAAGGDPHGEPWQYLRTHVIFRR